MTHPSSPPAPMTAATLQQHRDDASDYTTPYSDGAAREAISDLLAHIDALTARETALEGAIRKFPHFENDEPITVEAISKVAGEHVDMIMSWVPVQTKIAFVDDDGRQFEIVYEDGDSDAGISSGWCVPEDADWQPAQRGIESELAAARKIEDGEVARAHSFALAATAEWTPHRATFVAGTIERLSAALKEAERRAERAEKMHAEAFRIGIQHQEAAQAAEAKLSGLVDRDLP